MLSSENRPSGVLTKSDFVRRYEAGEFGNRSPTWNNIEEFKRTDYIDSDDLFHIRNRVAGGPTWYDVKGYLIAWTWWDICFKKGALEQDLYISAMCPTPLTTIQGELVEIETGELRLYYSTVKKPMRDSLREGGRTANSLETKILLERFMNPRSLGWTRWLLEAYPRHVIEFTCLSRCWGTNPGYNTLFWEVRGGY